MSELRQEIAEILRSTPYGNGVLAPLDRIMKKVNKVLDEKDDEIRGLRRTTYLANEMERQKRVSQEESNE